MNELRHSLLTYPDWGFVIYRTTYSVESDTLFLDAVRFIEGCFKEEFFTEADRYAPNELSEIWAKNRSTIVQDPAQFDGASLETISAHFEAWVEAQGMRDYWTKWRMCMIIDEESLQTLKGAPIETPEDGTLDDADKELRYVKVLEAFPILDKYDTFPGWMKCWPYVLFDLWSMMGDGDEMRGSFCCIDDPPLDEDEDFPFQECTADDLTFCLMRICCPSEICAHLSRWCKGCGKDGHCRRQSHWSSYSSCKQRTCELLYPVNFAALGLAPQYTVT